MELWSPPLIMIIGLTVLNSMTSDGHDHDGAHDGACSTMILSRRAHDRMIDQMGRS